MLLTNRLTLLSAPAGYGKTTLIESVLRASSDLDYGWLSLDADDSDLVQLFCGITAALRRIAPQFGNILAELLLNRAAIDVAPRRLTGLLINEVVRSLPRPFLLVLDDLHLVQNPTVFSELDFLIERMPDNMHLVVTTRVDPPMSLARLRARRHVAEIRLDDLRFTADETESFFTQIGQRVAPAKVRQMNERFEGWAAGLCLAAASLSRGTPAGDRPIGSSVSPVAQAEVFAFLAQEVVDHLEPWLRSFLLATSVLADLTAPLCQAVTGDTRTAERLAELARLSLFITSVEPDTNAATGPTYRYHALFAEYLQDRLRRDLGIEELRRIHGLAARAEASPSRATHHFVAARLWSDAAAAIVGAAPGMLRAGLADRLGVWIAVVPAEARTNEAMMALAKPARALVQTPRRDLLSNYCPDFQLVRS
jgi:LuxR family maltose regulon positive regulatory protein